MKVLRVLAEKNKRYTIDELAEMCHRSKASISRALKNADRYPFIKKETVPGTKQLIFGLDPQDRYATPIKTFFEVERERERQGTIPVDMWNLLEDITKTLSNQDYFIEVFLFGSYATGEYHAGSDIDLLLAHTSTGNIQEKIGRSLEKIGDERLHVIPLSIPVKTARKEDKGIMRWVRENAPVRHVDVLIPLSGEITESTTPP